MAEDVEVAVVGEDFEALVIGAVPLVENFLHIEISCGWLHIHTRP